VLTDATAISARTVEAVRSSAIVISPSTSANVPRTRLIRCRTAKPITLWAGSIRQVPLGTPGNASWVRSCTSFMTISLAGRWLRLVLSFGASRGDSTELHELLEIRFGVGDQRRRR
jgi:hypothetical protein